MAARNHLVSLPDTLSQTVPIGLRVRSLLERKKIEVFIFWKRGDPKKKRIQIRIRNLIRNLIRGFETV